MAFSPFVARLLAAAATLRAASAAAVATRDGSLLRWKGPVWSDKPDVIIDVKDVDELWDRVLAMNPGWVMQIANLGQGTSLDNGFRLCGADSGIATGNSDEVSRILTRLGALKGTWRIEGGRCHRIGCGENTGVYWCNDNAWSIRTSARALYIRGCHIRDGCCHRPDGSLDGGDPLSGVEAFTDNHPDAANSRVAVGYGSCSDNINTVPLIYGFPGELGICRTHNALERDSGSDSGNSEALSLRGRSTESLVVVPISSTSTRASLVVIPITGTSISPIPNTTSGAGSGLGPSGSQPCSPDGAVVCFSPTSFGLCNHGAAIPQPVGPGTTCNNGKIIRRSAKFAAF